MKIDMPIGEGRIRVASEKNVNHLSGVEEFKDKIYVMLNKESTYSSNVFMENEVPLHTPLRSPKLTRSLEGVRNGLS